MTPYSCMTREALEKEYTNVLAAYEAVKAKGLTLNMARGKPSTRTCLVTDADLEAFNQLIPNYYYYDQAGYPRTPDRAS